jgi:hypothetical protein
MTGLRRFHHSCSSYVVTCSALTIVVICSSLTIVVRCSALTIVTSSALTIVVTCSSLTIVVTCSALTIVVTCSSLTLVVTCSSLTIVVTCSSLTIVYIVFFRPTIAQGVYYPISTMKTRVWSHINICGICDGHSGTESRFLLVLRFIANFHSTNCSTIIIV